MDTVQHPDLIFDIGAHKGEDSDFYLKLGYRVVGVEANPVLAAELRQRFSAAIDRADYALVDSAIGETNGSISFFVNKTVSAWGTADPKWAERNKKVGAGSQEIAVNCIRFADLIAQYGCPHYLKIDIEGADMMCVKALQDMSCRPKYVSLESTKTSWSDLMDEFDTFEALGYTKFKVVRQGRHKSGDFTDLNGRKVHHKFEKEASGLFGKDLDGPWLTRRQAILLRYIPIFFLYKTIGDTTFLSRLFSRVPIIDGTFRSIVGWYDTHAMRE